MTLAPYFQMDDDATPEIGLAIQNHFKAIDVKMGKGRHSKHRQSLVTLSRRHSMIQMLDNLDLDGPSPARKVSIQKSVDCPNQSKVSVSSYPEGVFSDIKFPSVPLAPSAGLHRRLGADELPVSPDCRP